MQSARKLFFFLLSWSSSHKLERSGLISTAFAEGTRTWEQSKFDELTKGTATGVAIRSTGGLELAPTFKSLYATPSTYIWAIAADDAGNVYVAAGAPARVYRITPEGKATIIFEPKELQVQALQTGPGGVIYAATAPDGKVYKLEHKPGGKGRQAKGDPVQDAASDKTKSDKEKEKDKDKDAAKPAADPSWSSSVYFEPGTKYIWDLALDKSGNLYVATGDHGEIYRVTPKGEHSVFFKSDETHIRVLAFDAQENLIAGSDGSGLIYRISPAGEGFVLYSAPKKEITALALDRAGNIYAAAVGEKRSGGGTSFGHGLSSSQSGHYRARGHYHAASSGHHDHARAQRASDGWTVSIPGRWSKRRLRCVPHCAGWFAHQSLDVARGHRLRAGLRFPGTLAGRHRQSRPHFCHHRPR